MKQWAVLFLLHCRKPHFQTKPFVLMRHPSLYSRFLRLYRFWYFLQLESFLLHPNPPAFFYLSQQRRFHWKCSALPQRLLAISVQQVAAYSKRQHPQPVIMQSDQPPHCVYQAASENHTSGIAVTYAVPGPKPLCVPDPVPRSGESLRSANRDIHFPAALSTSCPPHKNRCGNPWPQNHTVPAAQTPACLKSACPAPHPL